MRVKNRVAIVTGGGRVLGKDISLNLAKEGADIAIFGKTPDVLDETAGEIQELGRKVLTVKLDVSDSSEVNAAVQKTLDTFGKVDILVNNAGISSTQTNILELTDERWEKELATNLTGSFYCMRAVLEGMMAQRYGKIISISSIAAIRGGYFTSAAYCAAKAGVNALTRSVAMSVAKYGINVNVVSVGSVPGTNISNAFRTGLTPEQLALVRGGIPYRRGGIESNDHSVPQDIADAVLFLASSESEWITGTCLNVFGGQWMG